MYNYNWKNQTVVDGFNRYGAIDENNKQIGYIIHDPKTDKYLLNTAFCNDLSHKGSTEHKTLAAAKSEFEKRLLAIEILAKDKALVWTCPNKNEKVAYLIFEGTSIAIGGISKNYNHNHDCEFPYECDDENDFEGYIGYAFIFNRDVKFEGQYYEEVKAKVYEEAIRLNQVLF